MKAKLTRILIIAGLCLIVSGGAVFSRDLAHQHTDATIAAPDAKSAVDAKDTQSSWSHWYGIQTTDEINASMNCYGQMGMRLWDNMFPVFSFADDPIVNVPDFESPPGSDIEYLFAGAIWVGGIVGNDTLVSVGADLWELSYEMSPPDYEDKNVSSISYVADYSLHALFCDTSTAFQDRIAIGGHTPLGLRVALRSHTWNREALDNVILYDMVITNISEQNIEQGYVGIIIDGDVYHKAMAIGGAQDDFAGSFREHGLGYIMDDDGDPESGMYTVQSPTRAIALKLIATSPACIDTNFNWWVSNSDSELDFGPRQRGTDDDPFYEFAGGALGTPVSDQEKYYIMSHPEWDYDLVYAQTIEDDDPIWMPLPQFDGMTQDVKMLMSFGPFDLMPDSSVRIVFATLTADSLHVDPDNYSDNGSDPDAFLANIQFDRLLANADLADGLQDSILNWEYPVLGINTAYLCEDSVVIEWDPWVYDEVWGYKIMLYDVPPDSLPYPDVIPPWLNPEQYPIHHTVGRTYHYTLTGLDPDKYYVANVAHRSGQSIGRHGNGVAFRTGSRATAPIWDESYFFAMEGEDVTLNWTMPEEIDLDHYNIYKFDSVVYNSIIHHPFYDTRPYIEFSWGYVQTPIDSFHVDNIWYYYYAMEPYATVDSGQLSFTENIIDDDAAYIITAVDKAGHESEISEFAKTYINTPKTRDILAITGGHGTWSFSRPDLLKDFYNSILTGYDYDIYMYADSVFTYTIHTDGGLESIDWRDFQPFRLVIIDDGLAETILQKSAEIKYEWFTKYLLSGGTLAYFGSMKNMLPEYFDIMSFPDNYSFDHPFISKFVGIDSMNLMGIMAYRVNTTPPYIDSLSGFISAIPQLTAFPEIAYDSLRYPFYSSGEQLSEIWPTNTAPTVASFTVNERGETIYLFNSLYPETSSFHNQPVGVRTTVSDDIETYLFGFHLWYMNPVQARELIDVIMGKFPTDVADDGPSTIPTDFALGQNYPNPFNPATVIPFALPSKTHVELTVYNILGQRVATLADEEMAAGRYRIQWNGTLDNGEPLASGIYFYRLQTDSRAVAKKMLLLK